MGQAGDLQPQAALSYLVIGTGSQQGSEKKQTLFVWRIKTLRIAERRIDMHVGRKLPSTVKILALHGNHCLGIVMSLRIENNHI